MVSIVLLILFGSFIVMTLLWTIALMIISKGMDLKNTNLHLAFKTSLLLAVMPAVYFSTTILTMGTPFIYFVLIGGFIVSWLYYIGVLKIMYSVSLAKATVISLLGYVFTLLVGTVIQVVVANLILIFN